MARMQQRREQRSSFGEEEKDFSMSSKNCFEEERQPRRPRSRHTEVLEDSRKYADEVESRPRRVQPVAPPKSADRRPQRRHEEFDEDPGPPPRSSRRHREEVEETPKRRDRERDRDVRDRDRDRDRDLDRDRDMDRDRRNEKPSRKKQQDDEEPLPPEVAKADFSTLQEMIAKSIKEAELQTELPELKPVGNDDQELRIREERRKKREEEEQQRVEERKRLRKEREDARLREIQEAQRQEEEEEERIKEEERQKKADEELQARKIKAATKIQSVHRGNCSRAGKATSKSNDGTAGKTPPEEEGDLLM